MIGLWHHYWAWVGGNVGAMPLQALITAAVALLLRKPIAKAWHRIVGERADLDDLRRAADAAHRIAADLFEHHTGGAHPAAPAPAADGPVKGGAGSDPAEVGLNAETAAAPDAPGSVVPPPAATRTPDRMLNHGIHENAEMNESEAT